ncbi:MAG: hypothetical protein ABIU77_03715 [Ferruginibacter sp.]
MNDLIKLEEQRRIILPEIYKDFYKRCFVSIPKKLIGTDLLNNYPELNKYAFELIKGDGADNFLKEDDFVFMMHQGYIFWFFEADGNPDPLVYGYHETNMFPHKIDRLSKFIEDYI